MPLQFPHNFNGKQLFVDSIGGEECSDANPFVKLDVYTDLASLQFDPDGYLPGGFVSDPGGPFLFDPHGLIKPTCALSSGETNRNLVNSFR